VQRYANAEELAGRVHFLIFAIALPVGHG
jgi:hypothetical protein